MSLWEDPVREIDHIYDLEAWLAGETTHPAAVQTLDARHLTEEILRKKFPESLFLGCRLAPEAAGHIVETGGTVIRDVAGLEFRVHRSRLYTVPELFEGYAPGPGGYERTVDARIYRQYCAQGRDSPGSISVSLARRLHDHSITDALRETIENRKVVAVMGGHGMERRDPYYRSVARIARTLTRDGYLMISGGGPGAMEATHLGAWLAARPDRDLDSALTILAVRPPGAPAGREYADVDWLDRAWAVREQLPVPRGKDADAESIGIPTWLYGHEPPAPFATRIAKYFANSVREDGLLAIARHGVIFAPGSAGTVQEIFQDAAQNHYRTQGICSPMVLFGEEHWTEKKPVWPLLEQMSRDEEYGRLVSLTDREDDVLKRIRDEPFFRILRTW